MSLSTNIEHYVRAVVTGLANRSLFAKAQRYFSSRQVDQAIVSRYGLVIRKGPFAGMKYIMIPPYRSLSAKLLGTYELELHPVFAEAIQQAYKVVINVGSAEGCYSVGYAVKVPSSTIYAFDIDPREREFCRQLAEVNSVSDRVHIGTRCEPDDFERLIMDRTLIIMDCEGCEDDLLDPAKAAKLSSADVILEIHDFADPSLKQRIHDRFSPTHTVTEYSYHVRNPNDEPETAFLKTQAQRELAVIERPVASQAWFYMRANR